MAAKKKPTIEVGKDSNILLRLLRSNGPMSPALLAEKAYAQGMTGEGLLEARKYVEENKWVVSNGDRNKPRLVLTVAGAGWLGEELEKEKEAEMSSARSKKHVDEDNADDEDSEMNEDEKDELAAELGLDEPEEVQADKPVTEETNVSTVIRTEPSQLYDRKAEDLKSAMMKVITEAPSWLAYLAQYAKAGRWKDREVWLCLCPGAMLRHTFANTKSCFMCHTKRPRRGFGGERPRK